MPANTRKKRKLDLNAPYPAHINLPSLPPIVLEHIFTTLSATSTPSLRAVTRSSKLFYDLATPILYRAVKLTSDDQTMRLLEGIDGKNLKLSESQTRRKKRKPDGGRTGSPAAQRYRNFGFTRSIVLDYIPGSHVGKRVAAVGSTFAPAHIFPSVTKVIIGALCLSEIHHERNTRDENVMTRCLTPFAHIGNPTDLLFDLTECSPRPGCNCVAELLRGIKYTWTRLGSIVYQGCPHNFWGRHCLYTLDARPISIIFDMGCDRYEAVCHPGFSQKIRVFARDFWSDIVTGYCGRQRPDTSMTVLLPVSDPKSIQLYRETIEDWHHDLCDHCRVQSASDRSIPGLRIEISSKVPAAIENVSVNAMKDPVLSVE